MPPVDAFTGEDQAVKLEDWLPTLQRAALQNYNWSPEEKLLQLGGHRRGHALQEWDLLSDNDQADFESAMCALRERLP